jgi:ketosteroid isomerase-like protein
MRTTIKFHAVVALCVMGFSLAFAQQRPSSRDEAAIRALEERWDTANLKGDAAALDALFADSYISTDSEGRMRTKAEVVGAVKAGNIKFDSAKTQDVKIILHGDAAVVSGIWRGKYAYRGRAVDLVERFTNFMSSTAGRGAVLLLTARR